MRDDFLIYGFYADGAAPESGTRRISNLSPKWIGICDKLLTYYGPVMKHNMGSTLSHFDIAMAGPMVELLAFGRPCLRLAISRGTGSEQDRAAVLQFREILTALVASAGNVVAPETIRVLDQAATDQCLLVLDPCQPLDDREKLALAQLGEHLAGAYFKYCSAPESA